MIGHQLVHLLPNVAVASCRAGGVEASRVALAPDAGRPSDPVDVVVNVARHVVVDHVLHLRNVQAARSDIRRHQYAGATALEIRQRSLALGLRAVAMDRRGGDGPCGEPGQQPTRGLLLLYKQ